MDTTLLHTGIPGRGLVLGLRSADSTPQAHDGHAEREYEVRVRVMLGGWPPYDTVCTQRVPESYLPLLEPGRSVVAVRVNAGNPAEIALDLEGQPPPVDAPDDRADAGIVIYRDGRMPVMIGIGSGQVVVGRRRGRRSKSEISPRLRRWLIRGFTVGSLTFLALGGYHLYRWIAFDDPVRRGRLQGCLRATSVCGGDALNLGFGIALTSLGLALLVTALLLAVYWRRKAPAKADLGPPG